MDNGIIKMALKVLVIAIILLVGSICIAIRYGGLMIQSSISTSDQNNGTGVSDSASPTNQNSMQQRK